MEPPALELLQFPYSHYNEKVRWALDYKRVPHTRRDLLPGPHALTVVRLTGQSQTPVVRFSDATVHGSARILDEIEKRFPDPALYPASPDLRRRALEIAAWFDESVGPQVRIGVFTALLAEPAYVCRMFAAERPPLSRAVYRATFPLTRLVMKRSMGITGAAAEEAALARTREALDFVARESAGSGPLVGDRFTVADLTAAALLGPAVMPRGTTMDLPEPRPARVQAWLARWDTHPGARWVRNQYRDHRCPPVCVGG
jgi:glutathione S-transferase